MTINTIILILLIGSMRHYIMPTIDIIYSILTTVLYSC